MPRGSLPAFAYNDSYDYCFCLAFIVGETEMCSGSSGGTGGGLRAEGSALNHIVALSAQKSNAFV